MVNRVLGLENGIRDYCRSYRFRIRVELGITVRTVVLEQEFRVCDYDLD